MKVPVNKDNLLLFKKLKTQERTSDSSSLAIKWWEILAGKILRPFLTTKFQENSKVINTINLHKSFIETLNFSQK